MNPINDDTRPEGEPEEQRQHVDATMAKRVVRKIDRFIIPVLFVTYMFNFMDRTILSSASVFGLREDTVRLPFLSCAAHFTTDK